MEKLKKNTDFRAKSDNIIKFFVVFAVLAFLLVFFVLPLISLLLKAFQDTNGTYIGFEQFQKYFGNTSLFTSLTHTLTVAVSSSLIAVFFAFIFSFILTRKNIPGKKFFRYTSMLPLFAPTMLLGICLIYLFGNKGMITNLGFDISLYGSTGIIIAESVYCFPVATTILMVAFSSADQNLYDAAEAMGTSALKKMLTITLPGVKYGLISALFVCFTYSFTDFGAPIIVGGDYSVLSVDIYTQVLGMQNFNMGAVISIIMLLPAVLSFIVERVTSKKQTGLINAKSRNYVIKPHKLTDILSLVFCIFITLIFLAFFGVSLFASFIKMWPYDLSFSLENFNFSSFFVSNGTEAFKNSIFISFVSALLGTTICFITAYITEKFRNIKIIKNILHFLSIAPLAIPGTVIGLGFIIFFNTKMFPIGDTGYAFSNSFNAIYGTIWILIIVNIIHFFSVPFTTATTALKKLDNEFETVSESMGSPLYKIFFKVTIPLCKSSIIEMMVFFFVNSMSTIAAVIFLYSSKIPLAAISIVNLQDYGYTAPACAMSIVILLINFVIRIIYDIISNRKKSKITR